MVNRAEYRISQTPPPRDESPLTKDEPPSRRYDGGIASEPTMTQYRGIFITHHAPIIFCDESGRQICALRYSFFVQGVQRTAETLDEVHRQIDESLGPEFPSA